MSSAYARRCAQTRRIPLSRQRDVHLTIESALRYGRSNDRLDDHPRDPSRDLSGDINPEVRVGGASPAGDAITNSSGKATVSPTSRASGVTETLASVKWGVSSLALFKPAGCTQDQEARLSSPQASRMPFMSRRCARLW